MCTVVALLVIVPAALAGSSVANVYAFHGVVAQQILAKQNTVASGTQLPFTGTNLAVMAAAGIALLGLGAGLRRVARKRG